MSSPPDQQPFTSPDPWHGQQPGAPLRDVLPPPYGQLPQPSGQRQASGQPHVPAPKPRHSALAITAIVLSSVALLMVIGTFVSQFFFAAVFGGLSSFDSGFAPPEGPFEGTAPQVIAGQTYPGLLLQDEVARLVRANGGSVKSVSCPATPAVLAGVVTTCHGDVDSSAWSFQVTFTDGLGHFTLDEKVD